MQHTTDATFYLDSEDIEIDIAVDPYEMPDPEVAENLFNCYLDTVHSTFPLMPANFEIQFRRYIQSAKHQSPYEIPQKWRVTVNLLFAIGAKYSQLIGAQWRGDERDHLIYMTRAMHLLRLKDPIVFIAAPTMDRVQAVSHTRSIYAQVANQPIDWYPGVLFSCNWSCQQSLDHDRTFSQACLGPWASSAQRESRAGRG